MATPATSTPKPRRLNNKERYEFEQIGPRIEQYETEQAKLLADRCDPGFYKRPADEIAAAQARSEFLATEIERLLDRWAELEAR